MSAVWLFTPATYQSRRQILGLMYGRMQTQKKYTMEKNAPNGRHRQLHHTRLSCMRLATCQGQASVFSIHPSPPLPLSNFWTTIPSPPFTFLRARNVGQSKERVPLSKKIKVVHDCLGGCSTHKDFIVGESHCAGGLKATR